MGPPLHYITLHYITLHTYIHLSLSLVLVLSLSIGIAESLVSHWPHAQNYYVSVSMAPWTSLAWNLDSEKAPWLRMALSKVPPEQYCITKLT